MELDDRKLSQTEIAKVLGVTQSKVSALRNYKVAGFSVERVMNMLTASTRIVARRRSTATTTAPPRLTKRLLARLPSRAACFPLSRWHRRNRRPQEVIDALR